MGPPCSGARGTSRGSRVDCGSPPLPTSASAAPSAVKLPHPCPGRPSSKRGSSPNPPTTEDRGVSQRWDQSTPRCVPARPVVLTRSPPARAVLPLPNRGERGRKGTGSRALQKSLDRGARGGKSADQGEHAAIGRAADTEPGRHIDRVAACASGGARRFCPFPVSRHHPR